MKVHYQQQTDNLISYHHPHSLHPPPSRLVGINSRERGTFINTYPPTHHRILPLLFTSTNLCPYLCHCLKCSLNISMTLICKCLPFHLILYYVVKDEKKTLNKNIADKKSDTSFIAFFHRISRKKNNRVSFFVFFNTTSIIVCEDNTAILII